MISDAAAYLNKVRKGFASQSVTYTRGAFTVTVSASVGKTNFLTDDGTGMQINYESRDFIIATADLILNGALTEPQRNDKIVQVLNGKTCTFEVVAPGSEKEWVYSDPSRATLRIHTKLIGVA